MKILCLSDLHQRMTDISDVSHQRRFTPFLQSIRNLVDDTQPDVAVVTGDTVPTLMDKNKDHEVFDKAYNYIEMNHSHGG